MQTLPFYLLLLFFISCKTKQQVKIIGGKPRVESPAIIHAVQKENYPVTKSLLRHKKDSLLKLYTENNADKNLLEKEFTTALVDSIFPYWYGTAWDFNGTTQIPGKGAIACGYFVTTTLEDAGVPLQRVKLAQCASQKIIKTLITQNKAKTFCNAPFETFLNYVREQGYGIYIVGLDCHVGFLYHDGSNVYFIHSKWANPKAVVKEEAATSGILSGSKYKIVAKLSSDEVFLKRWIQN